MKAHVLKSSGNMKYENVDIMEPNANQVQVQVKACGICGTDLHAYAGKHDALQYPVILGHELSGVVNKTGKYVKNLNIGDRVVVDPNITCGYCDNCKNGKVNFCENMKSVGINYPGGFGEFVTVPEKVVYKIPDNITFKQAAIAEPISCIVHAFENTDVKNGGSAVILGTGFIGLTFLQILKGMGYYPIYIMGRNLFRNRLAEKFGADKILDNIYSLMKSDIVNRASLVVETTGNAEILSKTVDIVSDSGKIFAFAVYPPEEQMKIEANKIYKKEITIIGDFLNPNTMEKAIHMIGSRLIDADTMEDMELKPDQANKIFENKSKNYIKPIISFE